MRVPYIVGRWVRDRNHYGRQRLFNYLLNTPDTAIWVVGARRIGKTSLLRQLEHLADQPDSNLVPLLWDMQGCETSGDLSFELYMALEDARSRFEQAGIQVDELEGQDALIILRRLGRALASRGKSLLLLIDEAEVLIHIARTERTWLARLRRGLQDGSQKTVIASTKMLAELNQLTADWDTSPFLFGFNMINLWSLDPESAVALIEQRQTSHPITVDPVVLEDILVHTNRHPYLIQYLCQRLYTEDAEENPILLAPTEEDLAPDHLLAGFFLIDFQHLTRLERRILLAVAERTVSSEEDILAAIPDESPVRICTFLWGLDKLGHVRQVYGQWAVGNEFLRRWLHQEWDHLAQIEETPLDDASFERILQAGHQQEAESYISEIGQLEADYAALRTLQQQAGAHVAPELLQELERVSRFLAAARRDFNRAAQPGGAYR